MHRAWHQYSFFFSDPLKSIHCPDTQFQSRLYIASLSFYTIINKQASRPGTFMAHFMQIQELITILSKIQDEYESCQCERAILKQGK
jgi:hypothetical protein